MKTSPAPVVEKSKTAPEEEDSDDEQAVEMPLPGMKVKAPPPKDTLAEKMQKKKQKKMPKTGVEE